MLLIQKLKTFLNSYKKTKALNRIIFAFFMLLLLQCAPQTEPSVISSAPNWTLIGPGGGGSTFIPTYAYHDVNQIFIKCDMTGNYLTFDGGKSFDIKNVVGDAQSFAFDPNDSLTIYMGGAYLYQSKDGGKNWKALFPKASEIKSTKYTGDHAEYLIEPTDTSKWALFKPEIKSIKVDPLDTKVIYFAKGSFFCYSFDGGENWTSQSVETGIENIYTNSHQLKDFVYIFTPESVHIFNKRDRTFSKKPYPSAMTPSYSFTAGELKNSEEVVFYAIHNTENKPNVYEVLHSEIWSSGDLGKTWQNNKDATITNKTFGELPSFMKLACAEYDAANVYVVCNQYKTREANKEAIWYGAFKSENGGQSWSWVWKAGGGSGQYGVQDAQDASNLSDAWVKKEFGGEFIQLIDVGVAPHNGDHAIVTDWYRSMKTTDGGKNWNAIYSSLQGESYKSSGLDVTTTYGVHFDPFDKNHIAVSYTDIGYHHSFDGGRTWNRSVKGVPAEWVNTCYWLEFDPEIKGRVWSAWSGMHDFPRGKMTRNPRWKRSGGAKGGICVSDDGGLTWTPVVNGMGSDAPATSIVLDPKSPTENRTLYASVYNKGVFKSVDGGKKWELKNNGLKENTCAFELSLATNGDLYLVISPVPQHLNEKPGPEILSGAVYKSTDGGENWIELVIQPDMFFPNGIAVDPENPNIVYLAAWSDIAHSDLVGAKIANETTGNKEIKTPGGIWKSEDGGSTWKPIFDQTQYVYDVTIDPHHKGRLYCNTFNQKAYGSLDGGKTWKAIKDYDFHWGHRVIIDENDHDKVYLTTFGSSIWHGSPVFE